MFIIMTILLAMSARWLSFFPLYSDGIFVLPSKLLKPLMWEIERFLCRIFLNMLSPVLKVSGLHTNLVKIGGVKQ
jgi:hypothetical protein